MSTSIITTRTEITKGRDMLHNLNAFWADAHIIQHNNPHLYLDWTCHFHCGSLKRIATTYWNLSTHCTHMRCFWTTYEFQYSFVNFWIVRTLHKIKFTNTFGARTWKFRPTIAFVDVNFPIACECVNGWEMANFLVRSR